jgi:hypothetical protein
MRRKWVLVLVLAVVAVLLSAVAGRELLARRTGPNVDKAHFNRIAKGMRPDEVEAILGKPPGPYTMRQAWVGSPPPPWWDTETEKEEWARDDGLVRVWFDDNGTVSEKWFAEPFGPPGSCFWRRLLGKLGL